APTGIEQPAPHTSRPEGLSLVSRRPADTVICLLLGIFSLLIYNANLRAISASDTYAARYLPFSIWRNHTLVLDPVVSAVAQGRRVPDTAPWIVKGRGDHLVSLYPVVVPIVIAPLYLPLIPYLDG